MYRVLVSYAPASCGPSPALGCRVPSDVISMDVRGRNVSTVNQLMLLSIISVQARASLNGH